MLIGPDSVNVPCINIICNQFSLGCLQKLTFSAGKKPSDHCGLKVNRNQLAAHTRTVHPKQKVKEKAQNMKTLDYLFPVSKKARLDEEGEENSDNIDATEHTINENTPENFTENFPGNEDINNKLSEAQVTVLKSIDDF